MRWIVVALWSLSTTGLACAFVHSGGVFARRTEASIAVGVSLEAAGGERKKKRRRKSGGAVGERTDMPMARRCQESSDGDAPVGGPSLAMSDDCTDAVAPTAAADEAGDDHDDAATAAIDVLVRSALPSDESDLWIMLTYAASMEDEVEDSGGGGGDNEGEGGRGGGRLGFGRLSDRRSKNVAIARDDPYLNRYVDGWGRRSGDLGVVAVVADDVGDCDGDAKGAVRRRVVGAAWIRVMPDDDKDVLASVADDDALELAIAVLPDFRGHGIGRRMMNALIEEASKASTSSSAAADADADSAKKKKIILSVREENHAAAGLYRSLGFREQGQIVNRVGGPSIAMELRLRPRTDGG